MDAAIDLSDPSKALDLSNIRFQLMSVAPGGLQIRFEDANLSLC